MLKCTNESVVSDATAYATGGRYLPTLVQPRTTIPGLAWVCSAGAFDSSPHPLAYPAVIALVQYSVRCFQISSTARERTGGLQFFSESHGTHKMLHNNLALSKEKGQQNSKGESFCTLWPESTTR